MSRVVALLRGVNIGKRRVAMAALRDGLEAAGCRDVTTYVQSGNVIFTPPSAPAIVRDLSTWVGSVLTDVAGFPVSLLLRTAEELGEVVAGNPYDGAGGTKLHVSFHSEAPEGLLGGVDLDSYSPEHCTLIGRHLYLHLPDGMGRARLPLVLDQATRRRRGLLVTTRNWNTVVQLAEMAG